MEQKVVPQPEVQPEPESQPCEQQQQQKQESPITNRISRSQARRRKSHIPKKDFNPNKTEPALITPKLYLHHFMSLRETQTYSDLLNKRKRYRHYIKNKNEIFPEEVFTSGDQEKLDLVERNHFITWNSVHLNSFFKYSAELGRHSILEISRKMRSDFGLDVEEVKLFAVFIWKNLHKLKSGLKHIQNIEKKEYEVKRDNFIIEKIEGLENFYQSVEEIEDFSSQKIPSYYNQEILKFIIFYVYQNQEVNPYQIRKRVFEEVLNKPGDEKIRNQIRLKEFEKQVFNVVLEYFRAKGDDFPDYVPIKKAYIYDFVEGKKVVEEEVYSNHNKGLEGIEDQQQEGEGEEPLKETVDQDTCNQNNTIMAIDSNFKNNTTPSNTISNSTPNTLHQIESHNVQQNQGKVLKMVKIINPPND